MPWSPERWRLARMPSAVRAVDGDRDGTRTYALSLLPVRAASRPRVTRAARRISARAQQGAPAMSSHWPSRQLHRLQCWMPSALTRAERALQRGASPVACLSGCGRRRRGCGRAAWRVDVQRSRGGYMVSCPPGGCGAAWRRRAGGRPAQPARDVGYSAGLTGWGGTCSCRASSTGRGRRAVAVRPMGMRSSPETTCPGWHGSFRSPPAGISTSMSTRA